MICDNVIFSEIEAKVRATDINAGWSSPVARQAHNLKVAGSNPAPATNHLICEPKQHSYEKELHLRSD